MTETATTTADPEVPGSLRFEQGIAWMALNDPAKKVNTLSSRFIDWFEQSLGTIETEQPRGLVIFSTKPGNFVAGADIEELKDAADESEILAIIQRGHALMKRLGDLPFPSVAAISGSCLGGGLELALACDFRVATEERKTKLGLPEVQLGLIPGLGGTQRLPRLIGVPDALDLILTGKQVPAKKAFKLGMVDSICHPADLSTAAVKLIESGRSQKRKSKPFAKRAADLVARIPVADRLVYDKARETVMAMTGGHYPAPLTAISIVHDGMDMKLDQALELEAGAFVKLVVSDVAKNLMSIFFMKNDADARAAKLAEAGREIEQVGVLGAGFMGAGIAQVLAYKGVPTVMKDISLEGLARGMKQSADIFRGLVKRRRMRDVEMKNAMARLTGTVDYKSFDTLDFLVEAVFEDVGIKHKVIQEVEAVAPKDLIFASNTSTIPIAKLAEGSARPENVVGMHFFSPVHKMPLLEIIKHPKTSDEALATTVKVGLAMGKTIIVVDDGPGFFTSRVLGPYCNEAAWLLKQGASIDQIDKALRSWGWPVGPIELIDEVGIDIAHHVTQVLEPYFGDRVAAPPAIDAMIADGRKGRKSGKGFYDYSGEKKKVDSAVYRLLEWEEREISDQEIVERCWFQMLNETARCIEDGVITNPVDVDLGVIFGLGFPPFRGGILRAADAAGIGYIVQRLEYYAEVHGDRLAPAQLLVDMAAKGETFHGI